MKTTVPAPNLPAWVWNALLDDLHERAVSLYQSGDRAAADELAEWITVLDHHSGNPEEESCIHIVCQGTGQCLFAGEGESA